MMTPAIPARKDARICANRVYLCVLIPEYHADCLFPPNAYRFLAATVLLVNHTRITVMTNAKINGIGNPAT